MSTLYECWRLLKFESTEYLKLLISLSTEYLKLLISLSTEYLKLLNSRLVPAASDFKVEYLCFKNPKNASKGTSFASLSWLFVFWNFFGLIFVDSSGDAGDAGDAGDQEVCIFFFAAYPAFLRAGGRSKFRFWKKKFGVWSDSVDGFWLQILTFALLSRRFQINTSGKLKFRDIYYEIHIKKPPLPAFEIPKFACDFLLWNMEQNENPSTTVCVLRRCCLVFIIVIIIRTSFRIICNMITNILKISMT